MSTGLPLELVHSILHDVSSPADLRNVRATCRTFATFATPRFFRRICASNVPGSGEKLEFLLQTAHIAKLVEEVVYHDVRASDDGESDDQCIFSAF